MGKTRTTRQTKHSPRSQNARDRGHLAYTRNLFSPYLSIQIYFLQTDALRTQREILSGFQQLCDRLFGAGLGVDAHEWLGA